MEVLRRIKRAASRRLVARSTAPTLSDVVAMQAMEPLCKHYLPWSNSAMRPSGLARVVNEVVINEHKQILELGGGVSTLVLGELMRRHGGHVHTVEHDIAWSARLRRWCNDWELEDIVSVVTAPLGRAPLALDQNDWYESDILNGELRGLHIDLLLVDGPPAYQTRKRLARYPAVPFFRAQLTRPATIVLDDISRSGEREIARRWGDELGVEFEIDRVGGIALARAEWAAN